MAASTEETAPVSKCPVIVIKLPFDLQERLLTFPFLHALHGHHPEAQIHFITHKKNIEVLNLLPFKAFYHEIEDDELENVFDVHRYCVNTKIFYADIFVSLTNSFLDACIGLGLKARQRLGFSDGWKTVVFNQKTIRPLNHHLCEDFYALYKVHTEKDVDPRMKVTSRPLAPIIEEKDLEDYIAINLSPLLDGEVDLDWAELIDHFTEQRFVFFLSEKTEEGKSKAQAFLTGLTEKNKYHFFEGESWIEVARMLGHSRGVVTRSGPLATISAYTGTKTLILYDRADPQREGPFYFMADVVVMGGERAVSVSMEKVATRAHEFFRL